jgi:hypothetical protein
VDERLLEMSSLAVHLHKNMALVVNRNHNNQKIKILKDVAIRSTSIPEEPTREATTP